MTGFEHADRLASAWSGLQGRWDETQGVWRDEVAERFRQQYWKDWEVSLPRAIRVFEELEQTLSRAETETR